MAPLPEHHLPHERRHPELVRVAARDPHRREFSGRSVIQEECAAAAADGHHRGVLRGGAVEIEARGVQRLAAASSH